MAKRIMVFYTRPYNSLLFDLFAELSAREYVFHFLGACPELRKKCQEQNWPITKIPAFEPRLSSLFIRAVFFTVLSPFLFFYLARRKITGRVKAIICLSGPEKIFITPLAALVGLRCVWLECPPADHCAWPRLLRFLYKKESAWAEVIALSRRTADELARLGLEKNKIRTIIPGIKPGSFLRQETIFTKLADTEPKRISRKFFTVGATAKLNDRQGVETLFQAVKKCLLVVPSLQLTVIGEVEEKKSLEWLAKKLEISQVVWVIGSPPQLGRWLENFDLFAVTASQFGLEDAQMALRAATIGLPIVGPAGIGLEDYVSSGKSGLLLENFQSEPLSQAIIDFYQNPLMRARYGQNAKLAMIRDFSLDRMVTEFEKIL